MPAGIEVDYDDVGGARVGRQRGKKTLQCLDTASRSADRDDGRGKARRSRRIGFGAVANLFDIGHYTRRAAPSGGL